MRTKLSFFVKIILIIVLCYSNSFSQIKKDYNLFSKENDNSILNRQDIKESVSNAEILSIDKIELAEIYRNRLPEISVSLPLEKFENVRLNLKRFDILTPDAKIVTRTERGNEEVKINDLAVCYTGSIEGIENSLVSINFTGDKVKGVIVTGDENYNLGALKDNIGRESDNYILFKDSDLKIKNNFSCFTEDNLSPEYTEKMRNVIMKSLNEASSTDLYIAEIAIEIDFITYNLFSQSVTNAANYAIMLMSTTSAIYMKEVNIKFVIPYLRVWTTSDPYTGTNSNTILNQFRNEWNANQQSVQRTLAHFITRRSGNMGGIAWVGQLCNTSYGYGFSNTDGTIQPLPAYSWNSMVVSHEIGHNFGSNHTHNCGWVGGPIDSCYATEGGCYTGPAIARVGTIMSYCHLNGSISLTKGFGPQPKAVLRNGAESAGCMYVSAREVQIGYPNGGESFRTGETRQIYWGASITGNVNIELSTNNGSSWQIIQNNFPAQTRVYDWTIPYMSSTIQSKIRIINSSNNSSGDTCNAPFTIVMSLVPYSIISPPSFTRLLVGLNNTETTDFNWSSSGTNPTIKYRIKFRKIGSITDYSYLSNNSGSDTSISIRKSFLDTLASVMGTNGDSVRSTWRVWSYNGIDSSQSGNLFLITFVRTTVGITTISNSVPDKFSLENNYPNPFNPSTNIKFNIANVSLASLKIYDLKGREVAVLVNEKLQPGSYEFKYIADNLPSGVYFYRLETSSQSGSGDFTQTKRMILLK